MRSISLYVLRYLLIACAVAACVYSLLLARAALLFQQDTAASIPAAVDLVPYNSSYVERLARWLPSQKVTLLERAVALNPFDYQALINLGLAAEFQQRNVAVAERYYLQAFQVNRMFLPKWTLTNFYFRQGDVPQFFHWATATLAITPYSPEPVFTQMWLATQDAARIAAAIPNRPRTLLQYAWFLSNNRQTSTLPPIVARLLVSVGRANPRLWGRDDLLAAIEDRLVDAGAVGPALAIWGTLARDGWIRQTVPDPLHPLINGNFRTPFYPHGFDWVPVPSQGVTVDQLPEQGLLRLSFSGQEAEHVALVQQYLPLQSGRHYQLRWQARSQAAKSLAGLAWHLHAVGPSATWNEVSPDISQMLDGSWQWRAPAGTEEAALTLEYTRPFGQVRAAGDLELQSVSLSPE